MAGDEAQNWPSKLQLSGTGHSSHALEPPLTTTKDLEQFLAHTLGALSR